MKPPFLVLPWPLAMAGIFWASLTGECCRLLPEIGSRFVIPPLTYEDPVVVDEDVGYELLVAATTIGAISMMADFLITVGGDKSDGELAASRGRLRDGDVVMVVTEVGDEVGATVSERIDEVASGFWAASSIVSGVWRNGCDGV